MPLPRSTRALLLPLLFGGLLGCADAATAPEVLSRPAGGILWVAASVPDRLPVPTSFGAQLQTADAEQLAELERAAWAARAAGDMELAARSDAESLQLLRERLESAPDERQLRLGLAELGRWVAGVQQQVDLQRYPAFAGSVARVRAHVARAQGALADGDAPGAAAELASGALRVQQYGPRAVALRVLSAADRALAAPGAEAVPEAERVLHLLHTARDAAAAGDGFRALQRALYALQLLDGHELLKPEDVNPLLLCDLRYCDA